MLKEDNHCLFFSSEELSELEFNSQYLLFIRNFAVKHAMRRNYRNYWFITCFFAFRKLMCAKRKSTI
jgi:hypothetical protein